MVALHRSLNLSHLRTTRLQEDVVFANIVLTHLECVRIHNIRQGIQLHKDIEVYLFRFLKACSGIRQADSGI